MNMLRKLYWKIIDNKWQIGFPITTIEDFVNGKPYDVNWLKGIPNDRWFADPFILDVTTNHIILLVEEFFYYNQKGRIAQLTISRADFMLVKNETVLDLDTHLSFPAIIRKKDRILIYPENSASKGLDIYEYDMVSNKCSLVKRICNQPLTDAVLATFDGKQYILSTQMPEPNKNILYVYEPDENGEFKKVDEVSFDDNIARNGGDFFSIGGKVYRPAQCCNGGYGRALSIQRIKETAGKFSFEEVSRLKSPSRRFDQGIHTLNQNKGVLVIDVRGYRWPLIGRPIEALRRIL